MFSIGYTLYIRHICKTVPTTKFGVVFYTNLLCVCVVFPLSFIVHDMSLVKDTLLNHSATGWFVVYNVVAGFIGFYLNFAQIWVCSLTSATTIAIIGALNKIPITIVGFMVFDDMPKITPYGMMYLSVGIIGGLLHAHSTFQKKKLAE